MTRAQAMLLRAFCAWTVFVWVVFVRNILRDSAHSTGFKVVHTVIAIISVAFAAAAWIVVRRVRRVGAHNEAAPRNETAPPIETSPRT